MNESIFDALLAAFILACGLITYLFEKWPLFSGSRRGRLILLLSVLSVVAAFYAGRRHQEKIESKEHEQTIKILAGIQRGMERIERVRLTVELALSADDPALAEFQSFLHQNASTCLQEAAGPGVVPDGQGGFQPKTFRISGNCLPRDPSAAAALTGFVIEIEIYKDQASTCDAPKSQDEEVALGGSFPASLDDDDLTIEYTPRDRLFVVYAKNLQRELPELSPSGKIIAVPDLSGSRMFVRFQPLESRAADLYRSIRPKRLVVQFVSPRYLKQEILPEQLASVPGEKLPSYVYCFQNIGGTPIP